jgi:hypothetical protein
VSDLPSYVWALVLAGAIGIPAVVGVAVFRGAIASGLGRRTAAMVVAVAGVVWGGWLVSSGVLADAGAFRQDPTVLRPWIGVAVIAVLAAVLLAARIPVVKRILADPGMPARLALAQTFRVLGVGFLVVLALGKLPAVFALPAGLGDIAIGVAAPFVARQLARGRNRRGAVWFNIMGIVDLAVAVSIGFLAALGPYRPLHVTPSTEAVTLLPLVLIPVTAVPLAIALHVVSLRALHATGRRVAPAGRTVPAAG